MKLFVILILSLPLFVTAQAQFNEKDLKQLDNEMDLKQLDNLPEK
tara:strand:+ start:779 stop:913 length:135 start_codon:yes stop_codon:yes gene_type:complete